MKFIVEVEILHVQLIAVFIPFPFKVNTIQLLENVL